MFRIIRGFANYQNATGPIGPTGVKIYWPCEFSTGPTILSEVEVVLDTEVSTLQDKYSTNKFNYDDFCLNSWPLQHINYLHTILM